MYHVTGFLILALLILSACGSDKTAQVIDPASTAELRTYEVSQGNARDIAGTLSTLIQDEGARARTIGDNLVVVSAPVSLHEGIEALLERLQELPPQSASRIRLHYWLVSGKPSDTTVIPSNLYPLRQALTEAAATVGPMTYHQLDYIQQMLTSDRRNHQIDGDILRVETQAVMAEGKIGLDMTLVERARRVGAYVEMDDGETILLAQIGLTDKAKKSSVRSNSGEVMMFLVRAERN